jgi:hypothetical protein
MYVKVFKDGRRNGIGWIGDCKPVKKVGEL